jgi:glycosyltransferase involved in cell wall biosynthesis
MGSKQDRIVFVIPVYNDWPSLALLLREIDRVVVHHDLNPRILIIDDGSSQPLNTIRGDLEGLKYIKQIDVIHLACNLGHQRAIALGLAYINSKLKVDEAIVMDCDGEDRPDDISLLLDEHSISPDSIIFAQRSRRSEGLFFRLFYALYKLGFRSLTGTEISFGSFALIPAGILHRAVYLPEIWNHFAAGVLRAKLPWKAVPTTRGNRYAGRSKMNFVSLVIHGLSAISIFIEILTVRLILLSLAVILFGIFGFIALIYIRYFTALAIPGWATTVAVGLVVIMFQAVGLLALLSFLVLNYRMIKFFIPAKDYEGYLFSVERVV